MKVKEACSKEELKTMLDTFALTPSFLKYSETENTKDAPVCGKQILLHADLARALIGVGKMKRLMIQTYLNTHQI